MIRTAFFAAYRNYMFFDLFDLTRRNRSHPIGMLVHKACDCSEHLAINTTFSEAPHLKCDIWPDVAYIINKLCAFALSNNPSGNTNQRRGRCGNNYVYLVSF